MPFDEMNILENRIQAAREEDPEAFKKRKKDYIDEVTDLFVLAYVYGTEDAADQLNAEIMPDINEMQAVIEERFDGKNYIDRLNEYFESGTDFDIRRVIETDVHRIYNAAAYTGARKNGATMKTWHTMLDPKVRDQHDYLEGVKIPIEAEFFVYNGDHTLYPGQFGIPEEDINCRCWVTFSKA